MVIHSNTSGRGIKSFEKMFKKCYRQGRHVHVLNAQRQNIPYKNKHGQNNTTHAEQYLTNINTVFFLGGGYL